MNQLTTLIYTDAKACWDGPGSKTLRVVGASTKGVIREVEVPLEGARAQRNRLLAAGFIACVYLSELRQMGSNSNQNLDSWKGVSDA